MSEHLHELGYALVEEFFGDFHAHLFGQLTYHRQLTAPQLAQKSHLPLRQVKKGLATLIQNRLVYHHTPPEGSSTYQANIDSTYDLLRIGRLIELVRNQHGSLASTIVSEAFVLGITTAAELEQKVSNITLSNNRPTTNGDTSHDDATPNGSNAKIQEGIELLAREGYLTNIRSAHLQSTYDVRSDAERSLKPLLHGTSLKNKKLDEELQARVDVEVRGRTSEDVKEDGYVPDVSSYNQRFHGGTSNALICVNFRNLVSHIRNTYLAEMAGKWLNPTNSGVLLNALARVPSTSKYTNPSENLAIDVQQLQYDVNHNIHSKEHASNGAPRVNGTHSQGDPDYEDQRGKRSYNQVDRSLAVLSDGEYQFLHGSYGKDCWSINKNEMDQFVQRKEIARLMSDRLVPPALRIVRMLMVKGKLDEKTLQELGLLSARELRQTLAKLKQMGYIDLQEVPRESQRQPNRTIYLWFHDSERVRKVLLDGLYKAMVRLLQKLKLERKKLSSTLEKYERTDVLGNEEQAMPAAEIKVLRRWWRIEAWMLGEVSRLDDSVALLRDL